MLTNGMGRVLNSVMIPQSVGRDLFRHNHRQTLHLGDVTPAVEARLARWRRTDFVSRLWNRDHTLWSATLVPELVNRLGWLTIVEAMQELVPQLEAFAQEIRADGIRHVVLLGMGGSSLAPEVFQAIFGNPAGHPRLLVLDSTHPDAVRAVEAQVDLQTTLFLVSSKSGTTPETLALLAYFWDRVNQVTIAPGQYFAAITDPGTPLEQLATRRWFRRTWSAPPDVGGRYAALTVFGLVPAALIGVDLPRLLARTASFIKESARERWLPGNDAVVLGAALGELALAGKDKATFIISPGIAPFGAWVEQLIAESTGKDAKGILPVRDEPLLPVDVYGPDRTWVYLRLEGDANERLDAFAAQLEASGKHPVVRIDLADKYDLGQEFFRWEVATAAASALLNLHPFNQPNVQLAKDVAHTLLADFHATSQMPMATSTSPDDAGTIHLFLGQRQPGDYIALLAYLQPTTETTAALVELQRTLGATTHATTTLGYGPRFLHSTGQFHKGGTNSGLFIQLVDTPTAYVPVPVPGQNRSFNVLIQAQALGDYIALTDRGRRVVCVQLGSDVAGGIKLLQDVVRNA